MRTDWATAKTLLGDSNFLRKLVEYPKDEISDTLLKKLQKYVDNPDFVPTVIEKVSKACKSLCMWVRALEMYARLYRTVEPKRRRSVTNQWGFSSQLFGQPPPNLINFA